MSVSGFNPKAHKALIALMEAHFKQYGSADFVEAADAIVEQFEVTLRDAITDSTLGSMVMHASDMSNNGSAGWKLKELLEADGLKIVRVDE